MPDILEKRYTDSVLGRGSIGPQHGLIRTTIGSTHQITERQFFANPVLRVVVPHPDKETVIEATHTSAIGSAFVLAGSVVVLGNPYWKQGASLPSAAVAAAPGYTPVDFSKYMQVDLAWSQANAFAGEVGGPSAPNYFFQRTTIPVGWTLEEDERDFTCIAWTKNFLQRTSVVSGNIITRGDVRGFLENTDVGDSYSLYFSDAPDERLTRIFTSLVGQWRSGRSESLSGTEMFLHFAYQQIVGLGEQVIPLILRELEQKLDHWFWALAAITRQDPVPAEFKGNMSAMREHWLMWGRQQGYRW